MVKNNKMRFVSLFVSVLILIGCVTPFAVNALDVGGGSSGEPPLQYAAIPFDYVTVYNNDSSYVFQFPEEMLKYSDYASMTPISCSIESNNDDNFVLEMEWDIEYGLWKFYIYENNVQRNACDFSWSFHTNYFKMKESLTPSPGSRIFRVFIPTSFSGVKEVATISEYYNSYDWTLSNDTYSITRRYHYDFTKADNSNKFYHLGGWLDAVNNSYLFWDYNLRISQGAEQYTSIGIEVPFVNYDPEDLTDSFSMISATISDEGEPDGIYLFSWLDASTSKFFLTKYFGFFSIGDIVCLAICIALISLALKFKK